MKKESKLLLSLLFLVVLGLLKIAFMGIDVNVKNVIRVNGGMDILSSVDIDGTIKVSGSSDVFSNPVGVTITR